MNSALNEVGWIEYYYSGNDFEGHLQKVALDLGTAVPSRKGGKLLETLMPTKTENANPKSLSKIYGLGEFPLHTDTAHWSQPCRFLVLGCLSPGKCNTKTILVDTHQLRRSNIDWQNVYESSYRIINGRRSFFGSIINKHQNFFRYDFSCMEAIDKKSRESIAAVEHELRKSTYHEILWKKNKVVVINNWRFLHGRTGVQISDQKRKIIRVLVI